jgi:hypothetical protein
MRPHRFRTYNEAKNNDKVVIILSLGNERVKNPITLQQEAISFCRENRVISVDLITFEEEGERVTDQVGWESQSAADPDGNCCMQHHERAYNKMAD